MLHGVVYFEDAIGIFDHGDEIVYWTQDEWIEDPQLIFSICNAVARATVVVEAGKSLRSVLPSVGEN